MVLCDLRRSLHAFLVSAFVLVDAPSSVSLSAELDQYTFKTHTFWVTVPGIIIDKRKRMIFRRYSLLLDRSGAIDIDIGLPNTMMFWCDRNGADVLVFHLHDSLTLKSFPLKSWKPKIDINILRRTEAKSSSSQTFKGEYIKGDLFIDLKAENYRDIVEIMTSSDIVVDFGDANDQIHFEIEDRDANGGKVKEFFSEVIRGSIFEGQNIDVREFRPLETEDMLGRCMKYRKTGR